jgi:UDP-glucose:(heptosyl)LPS alpha-1,3-glucosyltransferase
MVLPTLYDPCANACLEAMSCGIPVVTTTRNGASELLPEAWMALGLDEDEQALAETVERALQTEGLGTRCRDAMERWPRDKAMQELMLVVEEQAG